MSRRDPAASLWDLLAAIDAIDSFVAGRTASEYRDDAMLRSAVERQLIVIGEVFAQMDPVTAARMEAPVRQIIGMRNLLVHRYDRVEHAVVHRTVRTDLPRLRTAAERELRGLGG